MGRNGLIFVILGLATLMMAVTAVAVDKAASNGEQPNMLKLPEPRTNDGLPLDAVLKERRTIRNLMEDSLTMENISQLLWAAQGITDDKGHRTAGSAWESYPLDIYVIAGNVTDMPAGIYHYLTNNNTLARISEGDIRGSFVNSSVVPANGWIKGAPVTFVITADFERARDRSMNDSATYIEAGMASQNLLLEVVSLDLGATYVGGFNSTQARISLGIPKGEIPIGLIPVGMKA